MKFLLFLLFFFSVSLSQEKPILVEPRIFSDEEKAIGNKLEKIYVFVGGSLFIRTTTFSEDMSYFEKYTKSSNINLNSKQDKWGGEAFFGFSYLFLDQLGFGLSINYLGLPKLSGVEIDFNDEGVSVKKEINIRSNHFIIGHLFEGFIFPYKKNVFNLAFSLLIGWGIQFDQRSILEDGTNVSQSIYGLIAFSFVLTPGVQILFSLNERTELIIGYKHHLFIQNLFTHGGSIFFGIHYLFEFENKMKTEMRYNETYKNRIRKNI